MCFTRVTAPLHLDNRLQHIIKTASETTTGDRGAPNSKEPPLSLTIMRAGTILSSVALATAPALAFKRGTLGFALGTKNADGSCKAQSDYEADFDAIQGATGATLVRGYSASDCDCAQNILPAAKRKGFKVGTAELIPIRGERSTLLTKSPVLGVWPDVDESFHADKEALTTHATEYTDQVYAVTVGSETLYRGNFTGPELLAKINDVKAALPGVKVGTADSWNKYADGTADALIRGGVELLMANAFAYWQGEEVGAGAQYTYFDDMQQALGRIQEVRSRSLR